MPGQSLAALDTGRIGNGALRAYVAGDLESFVSFFDPSAQLHIHSSPPLPFAPLARGQEEILRYFRQRSALTPIRRSVWTMILSNADGYILLGVSEYGGEDHWVEAPVAAWYRINEGKIQEGNTFLDTSAMQRFMRMEPGVSKPHGGGWESAINSAVGVPAELFGPPSVDFGPILSLYESGAAACRSNLLPLLGEQVLWHGFQCLCLPAGGQLRGAQDCETFFRCMEEHFEFEGLTIQRTLQAEDTLALHTEQQLRHRRSGQRLSLPCFQALTLRDGRIVRALEVCDSLKLEQAQ